MDLRNDQPCSVCGRYNNRRVAVDALIIRNDEILLINRKVDPFKDMWAIPGGGIEFDQTAEDAIKKEVEEEVGLRVVSSKFLQIYTDPKRDPKQVMTLSYLVLTEGEPKAGSDASYYQFFSLNNLPDIMAFDHKQIILDYIAQSKTS